MAVMAILQDVDKCIRCNGCVISCKRTWQMKGILPLDEKPHQKVAINQRVVVKPQKRVDAPPFVRYSCWHCPDPPCARRCPWKAIKKDVATGRVFIDPDLCTPNKRNPATNVACGAVCQIDCGRGGYPKIGAGADGFGPKAWKCTMCHGRSGSDAELTTAMTDKYGPKLPTTATQAEIGVVAEKAHMPACVYTCPAKAMVWDTRQNIIDMVNAGITEGSVISYCGDGSMFWYSKKYMLIAPKADPFMEDHVSPMVGSLLSGPFAKAALVPTLVVGGLLALAARRTKIAEEQGCATAGEAR